MCSLLLYSPTRDQIDRASRARRAALTAVKLRTDDVADNISTNPATLHKTSPPAQTIASLDVISNGTQTKRNNRSATARLIKKDDVTLEPA